MTGATVVERDSYDAWGKRRNSNGSDNTLCTVTSQTTRGFTNQEAIDSQCLVNLNARIYDPAIGRFMTPDDVVPEQFNPQAINRFTYVENGPLSYTDPTGHDLQTVRFAVNSDGTLGKALGTVTDGQLNAGTEVEAQSIVAAAAIGVAGYSLVGGQYVQIATSGSVMPVVGLASRDPAGLSPRENFILAHYDDAAAEAQKIDQTTANLLGVSGLESGWGNGRFARDGHNNFFSEHAPAPFQNGELPAGRNPKVHVATFPDYKTSLQSFLNESGHIIAGHRDAYDFARALQNSRKYGIDPETGHPVRGYVRDTAKTILGIQKYLDEHGMN